jgi:hypothetical protein
LLKDRISADPLDYKQSFLKKCEYKEGITKLPNDQKDTVNNYRRDFYETQQAFELFGQVVLYDERRGSVES